MKSSAVGLALWVVLAASARGDGPARRFQGRSEQEAIAWQKECRQHLAKLLKLDDTVKNVPLNAKVQLMEQSAKYSRYDVELNATARRRMMAVLTIPTGGAANKKSPAVVCVHGHGGNRCSVFDPNSPYRAFARTLAERGYVTISVDVDRGEGARHTHVYEPGRTLMGERLGDLLRAVDYLESRPDVDSQRMGVAGLSLGGEMAMWLGAMDPRMKATVSSGFLTTVANMRRGHCPCWDFPGFTENYDFADIYSLVAPRALCCQIGMRERAPGGFPADIAGTAMADIRRVYAMFGSAAKPVLDLHAAGHVYAEDAPLQFLARELQR